MLPQERIEEIRAKLLSRGYYLKCRPNVYAAAMRDTSTEYPPKPLAAAVRAALIGPLPDGSPPQVAASGATDREAVEKAFGEWQRQATNAPSNDPGAAA
jgi:hypothetical protein